MRLPLLLFIFPFVVNVKAIILLQNVEDLTSDLTSSQPPPPKDETKTEKSDMLISSVAPESRDDVRTHLPVEDTIIDSTKPSTISDAPEIESEAKSQLSNIRSRSLTADPSFEKPEEESAIIPYDDPANPAFEAAGEILINDTPLEIPQSSPVLRSQNALVPNQGNHGHLVSNKYPIYFNNPAIKDYKCPEEYNYFAIPNECDHFIECKKFSAMEFICPDGLFFNPEAVWPDYPCANPSDVVCKIEIPVPDPLPKFICPDANSYHSIDRCDSFIECKQFNALKFMCPDGLHFSPAIQWPDYPCVDPLHARCGIDTLPTPPPTKIIPEPTSTFLPVLSYECSDENYYYSNRSECYSFIECKNKIAMKFLCPDGLQFDPEVKWPEYPCREASIVRCGLEVQPIPLPNPQPQPLEPEIHPLPQPLPRPIPRPVPRPVPLPSRPVEIPDTLPETQPKFDTEHPPQPQPTLRPIQRPVPRPLPPRPVEIPEPVQEPIAPQPEENLDPKSQPQPIPRPIPRPVPRPIPLPRPAPQTTPRPIPTIEPKPIPSPEPKPEIQPAPKLEPELKPQPNPEVPIEPIPQPIPEPRPILPPRPTPTLRPIPTSRPISPTLRPSPWPRPTIAPRPLPPRPIDPTTWQTVATTASTPKSLLDPLAQTLCSEENLYYAIPNECNAFIECKKYHPMKFMCPDELQFDPLVKWPEYPCTDASLVKCGLTPDKDPEPVSTPIPTIPTIIPTRPVPTLRPNPIPVPTRQPILPISTRAPQPWSTEAQPIPTLAPTVRPVPIPTIKPNPPISTKRPFTPTVPNKDIVPGYSCPQQYGYFALQDGDCSKYLMCQEGLAIIMNCPPGLVFNDAQSSCDWPENVPSCSPLIFKGFSCPAPGLDESGQLDDAITKFRYGQKCNEYIACQRGHPRLLSCDPGLRFDDESESCIDAEYVSNCN